MSHAQPRRRWGRITALVGAAAALLLSGMAPVSANEGLPISWNLPPTDVSSVGSYSPRVAVGSGGVGAVAWEGDSGIQVSIMDGDANASAPISLGTADFLPSEPQVAVGPRGGVTVVWQAFAGSPSKYVVRYSTRAPGTTTFSAAQNVVGSQTNDNVYPLVAYGSDGATTVAWAAGGFQNQDPLTIKVATRAAGASAFSAVSGAVSGEVSAADADYVGGLAYLPNGAISVMWTGTLTGLMSATRASGGGSFGSPEKVADQAESFSIDAAADGAAAVVWNTEASGVRNAYLKTRPVSTSAFGSQVALGEGFFPQVHYGPDGSVTVASLLGTPLGNDLVVRARTRAAGATSFSDPEVVSGTAGQLADFDLAMGPDGTTTVAWRKTSGDTTVVQVATRPAGAASFAKPVDLTTSGQVASCVLPNVFSANTNSRGDVGAGSINGYWDGWCGPHVAFFPSGRVAAVWGTEPRVIQVSGSPSAMAPVPTGKIQAATGVVPIPAPTPTPTPTPTPVPISGEQASLKVKALGKKKKLSVGETTKVVRKVKTDAKIKKVQTNCYLKGQKLTGKDRKQLCGIKIKRNKKKNAKVWVTPACSAGLKYTTKITANGQGVTKNTWQRTWKVKNKPRISCALRGTG